MTKIKKKTIIGAICVLASLATDVAIMKCRNWKNHAGYAVKEG